jgi:hypothetical protein
MARLKRLIFSQSAHVLYCMIARSAAVILEVSERLHAKAAATQSVDRYSDFRKSKIILGRKQFPLCARFELTLGP